MNSGSFELNVPLRTWTFQAFPIGMLWRTPAFRSWFYSFHINFSVPHTILPHGGFVFLDPILGFRAWMRMGFLEQVACPSQKSADEAVRLAGESTRRGCCIRLMIDEYFVPDSLLFRQDHTPHESLLVESAPDAAGFRAPMYRKDRSYRLVRISDETLAQAIAPVLESDKWEFDIFSRTRAVPEPGWSLSIISEQLNRYLASQRSPQAFPWFDNTSAMNWSAEGHWHGVIAVEKVLEYIVGCEERGVQVDFRITRQLFELKAIMRDRISIFHRCFGDEIGVDVAPFFAAAEAARAVHLQIIARAVHQGNLSLRSVLKQAKAAFDAETEALTQVAAWLKECPADDFADRLRRLESAERSDLRPGGRP